MTTVSLHRSMYEYIDQTPTKVLKENLKSLEVHQLIQFLNDSAQEERVIANPKLLSRVIKSLPNHTPGENIFSFVKDFLVRLEQQESLHVMVTFLKRQTTLFKKTATNLAQELNKTEFQLYVDFIKAKYDSNDDDLEVNAIFWETLEQLCTPENAAEFFKLHCELSHVEDIEKAILFLQGKGIDLKALFTAHFETFLYSLANSSLEKCEYFFQLIESYQIPLPDTFSINFRCSNEFRLFTLSRLYELYHENESHLATLNICCKKLLSFMIYCTNDDTESLFQLLKSYNVNLSSLIRDCREKDRSILARVRVCKNIQLLKKLLSYVNDDDLKIIFLRPKHDGCLDNQCEITLIPNPCHVHLKKEMVRLGIEPYSN